MMPLSTFRQWNIYLKSLDPAQPNLQYPKSPNHHQTALFYGWQHPWPCLQIDMHWHPKVFGYWILDMRDIRWHDPLLHPYHSSFLSCDLATLLWTIRSISTMLMLMDIVYLLQYCSRLPRIDISNGMISINYMHKMIFLLGLYLVFPFNSPTSCANCLCL